MTKVVEPGEVIPDDWPARAGLWLAANALAVAILWTGHWASSDNAMACLMALPVSQVSALTAGAMIFFRKPAVRWVLLTVAVSWGWIAAHRTSAIEVSSTYSLHLLMATGAHVAALSLLIRGGRSWGPRTGRDGHNHNTVPSTPETVSLDPLSGRVAESSEGKFGIASLLQLTLAAAILFGFARLSSIWWGWDLRALDLDYASANVAVGIHHGMSAACCLWGVQPGRLSVRVGRLIITLLVVVWLTALAGLHWGWATGSPPRFQLLLLYSLAHGVLFCVAAWFVGPSIEGSRDRDSGGVTIQGVQPDVDSASGVVSECYHQPGPGDFHG